MVWVCSLELISDFANGYPADLVFPYKCPTQRRRVRGMNDVKAFFVRTSACLEFKRIPVLTSPSTLAFYIPRVHKLRAACIECIPSTAYRWEVTFLNPMAQLFAGFAPQGRHPFFRFSKGSNHTYYELSKHSTHRILVLIKIPYSIQAGFAV